MKKIPTLFTRVYENHRIVDVLDEITPGCEEAFKEGIATIKIDGSCCAVIDGVFYKRYDAKNGKTPPEGAIPCCEPDPVTGHWPHWVKVDLNNTADRYFVEAYKRYVDIDNPDNVLEDPLYAPTDGTYECVGPKVQGNPYRYIEHRLIPHGIYTIEHLNRDFESIKRYLGEHNIEGIVFWYAGNPVCKIKRTDFGFKWPV